VTESPQLVTRAELDALTARLDSLEQRLAETEARIETVEGIPERMLEAFQDELGPAAANGDTSEGGPH
jgi:BMFP domain-containing protein YqiC